MISNVWFWKTSYLNPPNIIRLEDLYQYTLLLFAQASLGIISMSALHSAAPFRPSHMLTHISLICSNVGIIDPEQLLQWVLSFFFSSVSPRPERARGSPRSLNRALAAALQNPAEDTSQMKFSSPSQETPSPFVFIILTSLSKELSSLASIRRSLSGAPPVPPFPPIYLELIPSEVQPCVSVTAPCLRRDEEGWEAMKRGTSLPR